VLIHSAHLASTDNNPDQAVGAAPPRCFSERHAKYGSGCFVGRSDTDLDAGRTSAHRGWADPVDREYRNRNRIG
jgi:hypothetical protein